MGKDDDKNGCACSWLWDPVCDEDGNKYSNSCVAKNCKGVEKTVDCEDTKDKDAKKICFKKYGIRDMWRRAVDNKCEENCGVGTPLKVVSVDECECGCMDGKCNDCGGGKKDEGKFGDYKDMVLIADSKKDCKALGGKFKKKQDPPCIGMTQDKFKCKKLKDNMEACKTVGCNWNKKKVKCAGKPDF